MKLQIDESEIKEAITDYIKNQGVSTVDKTVTIELTAGRNGNGHKAAIKIVACEPDLSTPTPRNDKFKTPPPASPLIIGAEQPVTDLKTETAGKMADDGDNQATKEEQPEDNDAGDTAGSSAESGAPVSLFAQPVADNNNNAA